MLTLILISLVAYIMISNGIKTTQMSSIKTNNKTNDMILIVSIILSKYAWVYLDFITNKDNYVILTVVSELLNLGRMIPTIYILKVVVDMHREYMKVCL